MLVSVCRCTRSTQRASRGSSRLGSFAQDEATETHLVLLGERLVRGRLEEEHAPGDVDDGRAGHLAQRLSERERLGRKDVAVAVVRACEGRNSSARAALRERTRWRRRDAPAMAVKHSSSGRALRWLHMRRSKPLATSTTSCASSPRLYSACMQHWVITAREEVEVRQISELLTSEEESRRRRRGRTRLDDTLQHVVQPRHELELLLDARLDERGIHCEASERSGQLSGVRRAERRRVRARTH